MKKINVSFSSTFVLIAFLIIALSVHAQYQKPIPSGVFHIEKGDPKIDSILQLKIEFDRAQYNAEYHTIQLYYGSRLMAEKIISQFKEKYPEMNVELSFETPNYKVQTGYFKSKIRAIKKLELIKRDFREAFLITYK